MTILQKSTQKVVILLFNMSDDVDALLSVDKEQVDIYIYDNSSLVLIERI